MKAIVWAWSALLIAVPSSSRFSAQAPNAAHDVPRVLHASERINFHIPMFGSIGRVSCDADGDMIFNVGSTIEDTGPFLRVQADGARHVIYLLPSELVKASNLVWTVSPGGRFYVLIENFKNHRLVHFNEDGSVAGIATLDIPPGADVRFIAITDDETVLLRGDVASPNSPSTSRTGFAALLNSSGRLVRDLSPIALKTPSTSPADGPIDGDAVAGADGRFYVLDEARVFVLNKSGEVERELSFKNPRRTRAPYRWTTRWDRYP